MITIHIDPIETNSCDDEKNVEHELLEKSKLLKIGIRKAHYLLLINGVLLRT